MDKNQLSAYADRLIRSTRDYVLRETSPISSRLAGFETRLAAISMLLVSRATPSDFDHKAVNDFVNAIDRLQQRIAALEQDATRQLARRKIDGDS